MGTTDRRGDGVGRRSRRWLAGALLVVAAYAVGIAVVGLDDAVGVLARASVPPLVGAGLLQVVVLVLWGRLFAVGVAAVAGPLRTADGLRVSMPAFTLSHTLPGGGVPGNALAVRRLTVLGLSGPGATAAVALASTISLATIAVLGSAGILAAFLTGDLPALALVIALPALIVLVGIVATVVVVLRSPAAGDRVVGAVGRVHPRLRERVDGWRASLRAVTEDPPTARQLGTIGACALAKWSADIASLALVFVALGAEPRLSALLVGFGVTQLATAIPVTPGGVGFVEGGMVGAFVALGSPSAVATSVVVVYRVIATWLPALAGVPMLLRQPDAGGLAG